jgi:hypothetical protein
MVAAIAATFGAHPFASLPGEYFERLRRDARTEPFYGVLGPLCVSAGLVADRLELGNSVLQHRVGEIGDCRLIAAAMSTLWRAARAFMFAKWTETRTQELHRLCPLFADRTQEDGKQTGRGQAHIPASHALTGQLLRLQWLMARPQPP